MASRIERYLAHLDRVADGAEPTFHRFQDSGDPGIVVMAYLDHPEPGHLVGQTYGLSLIPHPGRPDGGRELSVGVRSDDIRWALVAGLVAETLGADCPFEYGDVVNLGERVTPGSALTAFLVQAPTIADPHDYRADVGGPGHEGHDIVEIVGLYPIHEVERQYIAEYGAAAFWDLEWDSFDVTRAPAV